MKKLFLTLCAAVISMAASAQDDLVATLTHDGSIADTYYGENALVSAYDNALEGDVITLSAGTFNCPTTIEKAIVIRGIGMETATEKVNVTKLSGPFTWTVPENPVITPLLEGVSIDYTSFVTIQGSTTNSKANISKCRFYALELKKGTFFLTHCIQVYRNSTENYSIKLYNQDETIACINNCVINGILTLYNNKVLADNSIIRATNMKNVTVTNSIIKDCGTLDASNIVRYCVATPLNVNYANIVFQNLGAESSNNTEVEAIGQIIQDYSHENYHLTETASATYLGNDGSEVGIYGGANPFSPIPTNPRVRKLVIDTTPGSNGKLNVNIEVE